MRLSKLKLVGFKSFVDPTTVMFPSNLTGVVGPNGCGKSNIIDAVRWILGESSAKNLRGESMADVIFNGSSGRKASGQASVELVFDNTEGRITGEFARFNEIALRRLVSRDGSSTYYLNGTRCRKKDITDIFLGTGLGPRSYSIIEQGMISRFVEAKPEDLRIFLEEAAGISKYKERRRETENRIRHTRENLERVEDIREELGKQLEKLKRQAEVAERFKVLRQEEDVLHSQSLALQWQELDASFVELQETVKSLSLEINAKQSEMQHIESELETKRQSHAEQRELLDEQRQQFYSHATEIAKIEQIIANEKEKQTKLKADLEQAEIELADSKEELFTDESSMLALQTSEKVLAEELEGHQANVKAAQINLDECEIKRSDWQKRWDACSQQAANSSQQAHIEKTKIHHLEEKLQSLEERIKTLNDNQLHEDKKRLIREVELGRTEWQSLDSDMRDAEQALAQVDVSIKEAKVTRRELQDTIKSSTKSLQTLVSEKVGLEALQKAALGYERSQAETDWLQQRKLSNNKRLAEHMQVDAGYEKACETVLQDALDAIVVEGAGDFLETLDVLSEGRLHFICERNESVVGLAASDTLAAHVKHLPRHLVERLNKVYCVDTLQEAIARRGSLREDESIIVKNGIWLATNWIKVSLDGEAQDSVIVREGQLKALNETIGTAEAELKTLEENLAKTEEQLTSFEERQAEDRERVTTLASRLNEVKSEVNIKKNRLQDIEQRQIKIAEELRDIQKHLQHAQHELKQARKLWQEAVDAMGHDSDAKSKLEDEQNDLLEASQVARQSFETIQGAFHECEVKYETTKSQIHSFELNIERVRGRILQVQTKIEALKENLNRENYPELKFKEELNEHLEKHQTLEGVIAKEGERLKAIENEIQSLEKQRSESVRVVEDKQSRLNQKKVDSQTFLVKRSTIEEQLSEEGFEAAAIILKSLPEEAEAKLWQENLKKIRDRIQRLGAINLAAIEEYETESERKQYLDEQYADLEKALLTLEDAIAKIDKETRLRFQSCYETVNQSFKMIFPRLFGGGQAYLELTGEDFLDTGVQVIARPPGKKNSTIHLLSGGEKAMTAVALVFSIFQLNPSPFCLLDEVDAPLDDANVARFCNVVREMSDKTQFIVITHNKLTMEMAQSLTGVTMQEPGVSRLVSVDVDEAVRLAEA